jgi:hypothetical protein
VSPAYAQILARKLIAMFPDAVFRASALAILSECDEARVQLACLKLGGTDLEQLKYCVETAKQGFRDVLVMAEYPLQSAAPSSDIDNVLAKWASSTSEREAAQHRLAALANPPMSARTNEERQRLAAEDLRVYSEWLEK